MRPKWCISFKLTPISSLVSLIAACNEFSVFSTLPPGNAIYPECGSFELTFLFINSISSLF